MPKLDNATAPIKVVTFSDVFNALIRGAPTALLVAILAGAVAFIASVRQDPTYSATVSLVSAQPRNAFGNLDLVTPPPVDPRAYQSALLEGAVVSNALTEVNGREPSQQELVEFKRQLRVVIEDQQVSGLVRIEVRDEDPERAAEYANAIAFALVDWDRDRARQVVLGSIAALESSIADIDQQLASAAQSSDQSGAQLLQLQLATLREQRVRELTAARERGTTALPVSALQVLNPSPVPEIPVGPRVVFNTFVAVVLGFVLGYGAQFIRWSLWDEVRTFRRLSEVAGLPVLAVFPKAVRGRPFANSDAGSFFRANVSSALPERKPLVIAITSTESFDDKAGIASTLAERYASTGSDTLLIDADLRRLGPGSGLSVSKHQVPGFEDYLMNTSRPLHPLLVRVNQFVSFDYIPTNEASSSSTDLIERGLKDLLAEARVAYDVIVIDAPPAWTYPDVLSIAPHCDGIILCVATSTRSVVVQETIRALELAAAEVVGTVLTGVQGVRSGRKFGETVRAGSRRPKVGAKEAEAVPRSNPQGVARVRPRR